MFEKRDKEKHRELWEKDKTTWQRFKINLGVKWRRYLVQTHGMGFILLIMLAMFMIMPVIGFIGSMISTHIDMTKYKTALEGGCLDKTFYAWNFKACENVGVRP